MHIRRFSRHLFALGALLISSQSMAADSYSFGVVPQQSALKTLENWGPVIEHLKKITGKNIILKTSDDIPGFQQQLSAGKFDFAYMNPHQYISFHDKSGYNALVKAKDKRIKGILVVRKDSPIKDVKDLNGMPVILPKGAFAAQIMPEAWLKSQGIKVDVSYAKSHDAGYKKVSDGMYMAAGGVMRTFKSLDEITRGTLKVLWTSDGYTPHAIAASPKVDAATATAVQEALAGLDSDDAGKAMLKKLKLKGLEKAANADWDDVRGIGLPALQ